MDSDPAAGGVTSSRCLFCGSTTDKRSREHVLRKEFKKKYPASRGLTFTHVRPNGYETIERPISQFDITVNHVCRTCNSGWLNELENRVAKTLDDFSLPGAAYRLTQVDLEDLAFWAFVRALVRTHASPHGKAPAEFFAKVYRERSVSPGCYCQIGTIERYTGDAGSHQSFRIHPGDHYVGYVAFELGGLFFTVAISDNSEPARSIARDAARQPRLWFPDAFCWTAPVQERVGRLVALSPEQACVAAGSLGLRMDMAPRDRFGSLIDPSGVVPDEFLSSIIRSDLNFADMDGHRRESSSSVEAKGERP